jgi:hypothetical protein
VTTTKNEARLLPSRCPVRWQFSKQITRYQVKDGCSGFKFDAAIAGINLSSHVSNGT